MSEGNRTVSELTVKEGEGRGGGGEQRELRYGITLHFPRGSSARVVKRYVRPAVRFYPADRDSKERALRRERRNVCGVTRNDGNPIGHLHSSLLMKDAEVGTMMTAGDESQGGECILRRTRCAALLARDIFFRVDTFAPLNTFSVPRESYVRRSVLAKL